MPSKREQDVGEQDRRVHADEVDRLQRDLDGQLGRPAHLEEAVLRADGAVLGQVAARLAHHPDGRALGGLAPAGAQEEIVVGHFASVLSRFAGSASATRDSLARRRPRTP